MTEVVDLSSFAGLRVNGTDAGDFLHAQLTCDVKALQAGQSSYGGYCTAKGRLLASFLLLREADSFALLLSRDIAEAIRRRLQMYVLRAKVNISPIEEPLEAVFGEKAPADALQSIRAGVAWITAATQEAFVPQMINLEKIGGVSFKKGCYPGQEIVARTQYLGKASRRMHRVLCDAPIAAGDAVYGDAMGDQACGTVVNAAPTAGAWEALAVVHGDALAAALHAQSLQGPILELRSLPYDL